MTIQRNLPRNNKSGKGQARHPLSGAAYFDTPFETTHTPSKLKSDYTFNWNKRRATASQNRRIRHNKPVHISVYADMITAKIPDYANGSKLRNTEYANGGIRGNVSGFSRASRKRMIELMAKVRNTGDILFLTLTYDDMAWLVKSDDHHADFEAFRRRFERAFPHWRAIWRIEVKQRKSGMLRSMHVPHFHLLVFTGRTDDANEKNVESFRAWGADAWQAITKSKTPAHLLYGFHVTRLRNRRMAHSYVSKYIGKRDDDGMEIGRRWGRIGRFNTTASEEFLLSDDENVEFKRIVRRWLKTRTKSRAFVKTWCRKPSSVGYTVFGLGDTIDGTTSIELMPPVAVFIAEAKRRCRENAERGRGYGD